MHACIHAHIMHACTYVCTYVMSLSKAIDPDHDSSDHDYYNNDTHYYYHSNYNCVVTTIRTAYNKINKQCNIA